MEKYVPYEGTIADGNCMFAAFAMSFTGHRVTPAVQRQLAASVRRRVVEFYATDAFDEMWEAVQDVDNVQGLLTRDQYIRKMSRAGEWGTQVELAAISRLYDVRIELYTSLGEIIQAAGEDTNKRSTRMFYISDTHYMAMFKSP